MCPPNAAQATMSGVKKTANIAKRAAQIPCPAALVFVGWLSRMNLRAINPTPVNQANRPWQLYRSVFYQLLGHCREVAGKHGFRFKNKLLSLDATLIELCATDVRLGAVPAYQRRGEAASVARPSGPAAQLRAGDRGPRARKPRRPHAALR